MGGPADHHGVVVETENDNKYLIHNTPASGVVATDGKQMSSEWSKVSDIEIKGTKTVGDAIKGGYTRGSARLGKFGEYLLSGLCIGTKHGVANALEK